MGQPSWLADSIGFLIAFGFLFLTVGGPKWLKGYLARAREESARHSVVALHTTGNAELDALENDPGYGSASPSAGQAKPPQARMDRWAMWTRDAILLLLIGDAILSYRAWGIAGPWALVNWASIILVALLVALVVVYARHGKGGSFFHVSSRLLIHEIKGLHLCAVKAPAHHVREHNARRADLLLEAHNAHQRDAEIIKDRQFEQMMRQRVERGRQVLETAMDKDGGLHVTRIDKVPHQVAVRASDGSTSWKTEVREVTRHIRIARVRGRLSDLRAVYDLQWVGAYDAKIKKAWEALCADATVVLRMAIGDLTPDRVEYVEHTGELRVDLMDQRVVVDLPSEPEIEDEPQAEALDLETPLGIGTPPLAVLEPPNRHAIGRTNEGRTASQTILSAIKKMAMDDAEIREVKAGPVVSTTVLHLPSAQASDIKSIEANLRFYTGQKNLRAYQAEGYPSSIAVEWPNASRATVGLREVCAAPEIRNARGELVAVLGVTTTGVPIATDVAAWPNGLVGGQPGAGKSGFENALLVSLLLRYSPADLRIIPVDPKKVELRPYRNLPHLLCPPIIQPSLAGPAFSWAVGEMERRYDLMERMGVKKLADLNKRLSPDQRLPRILIVVDEAQMVMENEASEKEIKSSGTALATMSRASGVHLLFATQKPVVDVVPTVIKGCLTTRVALSTATAKESEVILDQVGAESLLGKGDLLARIGEGSTLVRAQSPWVADEEVDEVVTWWVNESGYHQEFDAGLMEALGMGSGGAKAPVSADHTGTSPRPRLVVVRDDEEEQEEPETSPADTATDTEDGDPNWFDAHDSDGGDDGNG